MSEPLRKRKRKGRPRPLPPDVTARNLAIEKQRREVLNKNFLELARLLPSLAPTRRLTKVLIVNEAIKHVRQQRYLCIAASRDMQHILSENCQLVHEVNTLRAQNGRPTLPPVQARPTTEAMVQLAGVEKQLLGSFPAGFGDNGALTSPQVQSDMRDILPDMALSTDYPSSALATHVLADAPTKARPIGAGQDIPSLLSGMTSEQAAFPCLDMFTPTDFYVNDQMLAGMPGSMAMMERLHYVDVQDVQALMQHFENGNECLI